MLRVTPGARTNSAAAVAAAAARVGGAGESRARPARGPGGLPRAGPHTKRACRRVGVVSDALLVVGRVFGTGVFTWQAGAHRWGLGGSARGWHPGVGLPWTGWAPYVRGHPLRPLGTAWAHAPIHRLPTTSPPMHAQEDFDFEGGLAKFSKEKIDEGVVDALPKEKVYQKDDFLTSCPVTP